MPRYTDYGSSYAVVNPDGTTTLGEIQYHWDGSYFVKILHLSVATVGATEFRAEVMGRSANEGDISIFSPLFNGARPLMPMYIAWLRLAIERGYTTLERAELVFKDFVALGAAPWGLDPNLPDRIEEDEEISFFGEDLLTLMSIPALDVLKRPNAFVDTTIVDSRERPWAVPAGASLEQVVGQAWLGHSMPELAVVAKALVDAAIGIEHAIAATPYDLKPTHHHEWIQKLYLAFFLRPADPGGFNYYADLLNDSDMDVPGIARGFGQSPEYLETYANLATHQRVDAIYWNLFGRSAEPDGLQYWGERLDNGTFDVSNIAFSILRGAQNDDLTTINHRIAVASKFTESLDTDIEVQAYRGPHAAAAAKSLLSVISSDPASPSAAIKNLGGAAKYLCVTGSITRTSQGDSVVLRSTSDEDIIIYDSTQTGRTDIIYGMQGEDHIDLSALSFGTAVQVRAAEQQNAVAMRLFSASPVVIERNGSDSYIFLDMDRNGNFDASSDTQIHIVGMHLPVTALTV